MLSSLLLLTELSKAGSILIGSRYIFFQFEASIAFMLMFMKEDDGFGSAVMDADLLCGLLSSIITS